MISVGTKSEEEAIRELEYVKGFLVEEGFVNQLSLNVRSRSAGITYESI